MTSQSWLQTWKAWPTFIAVQLFAVMINVGFTYYAYWLHITPFKDMVYRYVMTKSCIQLSDYVID